MRAAAGALAIAAAVTVTHAGSAAPIVADRVVARYSDPEASESAAALRFVMMRELLLEAWLVAYERAPTGTPTLDDKAVRLALERHVIEAVLGARALPSAFESKVARQTADARLALDLAIGGGRLSELQARIAGTPSGCEAELSTILRRRARAELYLEAAGGLAYEPTEGELHAAHGRLLAGEEFAKAAPQVRALLRTTRLREGAQAYHQAVRSKLRLEIVSET